MINTFVLFMILAAVAVIAVASGSIELAAVASVPFAIWLAFETRNSMLMTIAVLVGLGVCLAAASALSDAVLGRSRGQ